MQSRLLSFVTFPPFNLQEFLFNQYSLLDQTHPQKKSKKKKKVFRIKFPFLFAALAFFCPAINATHSSNRTARNSRNKVNQKPKNMNFTITLIITVSLQLTSSIQPSSMRVSLKLGCTFCCWLTLIAHKNEKHFFTTLFYCSNCYRKQKKNRKLLNVFALFSVVPRR